MKKKHTIKELEELMEHDLLKCTSPFERSMVKAVCGMEIRARREEEKSGKCPRCNGSGTYEALNIGEYDEEMVTVRCACIK